MAPISWICSQVRCSLITAQVVCKHGFEHVEGGGGDGASVQQPEHGQPIRLSMLQSIPRALKEPHVVSTHGMLQLLKLVTGPGTSSSSPTTSEVWAI
eukprot:1159303-Prymnesium_polylepis.1